MSSIPTLSDRMSWSEAMKRAIVNGDTVSAGIELLRMNAGFRALPVDRETKAPIPFLTPRGVADATDDPVILQQWMALASDAGLGAVPGSNFAIIDDDTGNLGARAYGLSGTFVERTRRGMHYWARLPESRHLKKSKLPDGAGDLICGHRAYVVMSPTPPYFPMDIDAPILTLPDNSPLWELAKPVCTSTWGIRSAACDREEARDLDRRIRAHSMYREGYQRLHTRDWQRAMPKGADVSESGRDFFLVFEVSHFVKNHQRAPEILYALLWDTGWPQSRNRANPKSDPPDYCSRTVLAALTARASKDAERLQQLADHHVLPISPGFQEDAAPTTPARTVLDANLLSGGADLTSVIERFAASVEIDEFSRPLGWRRFPVMDVAEIFGYTREAVRKRMVAMERAGIIERRSVPYTHDGAIRRDTCIRLPRGHRGVK